MLAHFAGDMRKHIALARKIDAKHRARQHLSHRTFGHDLFFFGHRVNYTLERTSLNRRARNCEFYRIWSSDTVGKYSPTSWRFHHAPDRRCSPVVVKR